MEVVEIISSFVNKENNILKVEFQMMGDEGFRTDIIEFEYFQDFGYSESTVSDVFDDIDDDEEYDWDWEDDENETYIDDETIISFLNEYYVVFPDRIPDEEYN